MRLKKNTKKGSYIVEAVLIMPIFILAVLTLISIIPIMSTCENIIFAATDEMRAESLNSVFISNPLRLQNRVEKRIQSENPKLTSCTVNSMMYRYKKAGINDLITLRGNIYFEERNPFGLFGKVDFDFKITGRAFTGTEARQVPLLREEFEKQKEAEPVFIFPNSGKKYHNKDCTYIKANCHMNYLNREIKKRYKACKKCGASKVSMGTPVYCFTKNGKVYHLGKCKVVKRYYIKIDREDALKKGYTPCSKCGGI